MRRVPKVFISYRHEDDLHRRRVRALAVRLRDRLMPQGIEIVFDGFLLDARKGGPDEGWPKWCAEQVRMAERVAMIASPGWSACFSGREAPGTGAGAACEAHVIWQELYNLHWRSSKHRVCLVDSAHASSVPTELQAFRQFQSPREDDDLVEWILEAKSAPAETAEAGATWPPSYPRVGTSPEAPPGEPGPRRGRVRDEGSKRSDSSDAPRGRRGTARGGRGRTGGSSGSTVFDQRGQSVGTQINVAGDAVLPGRGVAIESPVRSSRAAEDDGANARGKAMKPKVPRKSVRAPKSSRPPIRGSAVDRTNPPARGGTAATERTHLVEPGIPTRLYVVFCRILGLDTLPAERLGDVQTVLVAAAGKAADPERVLSSVYGRILVFRDPAQAMDGAITVLDAAAAGGLRLAIGVAVGRLEEVADLGRTNLTGPALSEAARLAALSDAEEHVLVSAEVYSAVRQTAAFPSKRFTGPFTGRVKRTHLNYYLLLHTAPSVGALKAGRKARAFEAHVVAVDLVRFSEKPLDDQEEVLGQLRKCVGAVLSNLGGRYRDGDGRLWYAPGGDGGVLVFHPADRGGDAAWLLARELGRSCEGRLEIRTGIATGSVVVIGEHLPVGTGVLRGDALSNLAEPGGICVNQAFWGALRPADTLGWTTMPVPGDPDALRVVRGSGGGGDRPGPPPAPIDPNARAVYQHVLAATDTLLRAYPGLRTELEAALRSGSEDRAGPAGDILDLIVETRLLGTLEKIFEWLDGRPRSDSPNRVKDLLCGLMALGVDSRWVMEQRAKLDEAIRLGRPVTIRVPREIELPSAEILAAALRDGRAFFQGGSGDFPAVERGLRMGGPEPRGPTQEARLGELRLALLARCAIRPGDPDANRKLEQTLRARWKQRKPIWVLFESGDTLTSDLAVERGVPWHYLLVLQHDSEMPPVLDDARGTVLWTKEILDRLDDPPGLPGSAATSD